MRLPRRYRSIFLAGPTFNLLPDDETARQALEGIRCHLEPGGSALIPRFVPRPTPGDLLGRHREHREPGGAVMRVSVVAEERDEEQRRQTSTLRYERMIGEEATVVERPWLLHWHTQEAFRQLTDASGLVVRAVLDREGRPASVTAEHFVFLLTRPDLTNPDRASGIRRRRASYGRAY